MKEKNQYYSKNVEFIATSYKPEGQITKQDYDLLISSQKMDFISLTQLLNTAEFKTPILNCALANLIQIYKNNDSLVQSIKLLLSKNISYTYKFTQKSNKTLLMIVIEKGDYLLLTIFLERISSRINSIKIIPNDKLEEYQISEIKKIFSQKDSYGNNFSHLFKVIDKIELFKMFHYLYYEFPFLGDKSTEISKGIQRVFQNLFLEKNDEGNTIMSLSLERNLIQIVFNLLLINGYKPNVNIKNNNLVHCAIKGKNLTCVKIILYYCSKDDLNEKNSDLLTPAQLASKLGLSLISNIINEYQNNFEEEEYKEHFFKNIEVYKNKLSNLRDDLLSNLNQMKYRQIFFELKELKIIYELSSDNFNINQTNKNNNNSNNNNSMTEDIVFYKISLLKIEWNIIICKIKLFQNNNNKEKDKENSLHNLYKLIYDFYYNNFTNEFILSYINYLNQINKETKDQNNEENNNENIIPTYKNSNKPIEIMIYNKIIFYFKIGDMKSLIETAQIYFTKKFLNDYKLNDENFSNKNLFILLVNISCILIETLISQGYNNFAQLIITKLEKYIFKIANEQQNSNFDFIDYFKGDISVFNYLTKIGVFNQYSGFFSELFCYINFLKILNNKEENKNKEYFTNNKRLLEDSKFAQDLTIFNKLNCLYNFLVIKKMYEKKEKELYDKLTELNYSEENTIYYFNTLGIIFLQKQKYNMSKFFFAKGYYMYMREIKKRRDKQDKLFNFRIDIITALLYNISLCYFHLRQYQKCITILECILNFKINRNNFFIHYRLGLCYYYLYIENFNKNADYFNKNIIKLIGYEKIKNFKKSENVKQLSIELDDERIISNLSQKFEAEHKKKKSKEKHENKFSFHNNDKNEKSDKVQHKYNNIYKSGKIISGIGAYNNNPAIKRIILKNSIKIINKNNNHFFSNNKKIQNNNNDPNKSDFLNKAIKCFKKVILISKLNGLDICSESMKSLYNFYSTFNKDEDDTVKDNTEKMDNFIKEKEVPIELLINSYFNLLMCLSMKKNWLEMILIIKDYDNRDITSNKIIKLKIWLYELEAYTNLKNNKKINEILSKIKKFKKIELSVLNKTNNDIINEVNIKLYIYYILTKIYIEEKNFKEADINIKKIIFLVKDGKNIPYYIIDLLLNVYIIKLNSEPNINDKTKYRYNNIILNLIKNKKINEE